MANIVLRKRRANEAKIDGDKMKKVIVTGGRDYDDQCMVQEVLNLINPDVVIQGGASGADKLAMEWAALNNKLCVTVSADWNEHGRSAGPIRNRKMLKEHLKATVIAFPGGKGTEDCVKAAYQLDMVILQVHK